MTKSGTVNFTNPSLQATNVDSAKQTPTSIATPSFWTLSLPSDVLTVKQSTGPTARLTLWTMTCTLVLFVPLVTSSKQSTYQMPWKKDVWTAPRKWFCTAMCTHSMERVTFARNATRKRQSLPLTGLTNAWWETPLMTSARLTPWTDKFTNVANAVRILCSRTHTSPQAHSLVVWSLRTSFETVSFMNCTSLDTTATNATHLPQLSRKSSPSTASYHSAASTMPQSTSSTAYRTLTLLPSTLVSNASLELWHLSMPQTSKPWHVFLRIRPLRTVHITNSFSKTTSVMRVMPGLPWRPDTVEGSVCITWVWTKIVWFSVIRGSGRTVNNAIARRNCRLLLLVGMSSSNVCCWQMLWMAVWSMHRLGASTNAKSVILSSNFSQ